MSHKSGAAIDKKWEQGRMFSDCQDGIRRIHRRLKDLLGESGTDQSWAGRE